MATKKSPPPPPPPPPLSRFWAPGLAFLLSLSLSLSLTLSLILTLSLTPSLTINHSSILRPALLRHSTLPRNPFLVPRAQLASITTYCSVHISYIRNQTEPNRTNRAGGIGVVVPPASRRFVWFLVLLFAGLITCSLSARPELRPTPTPRGPRSFLRPRAGWTDGWTAKQHDRVTRLTLLH